MSDCPSRFGVVSSAGRRQVLSGAQPAVKITCQQVGDEASLDAGTPDTAVIAHTEAIRRFISDAPFYLLPKDEFLNKTGRSSFPKDEFLH